MSACVNCISELNRYVSNSHRAMANVKRNVAGKLEIARPSCNQFDNELKDAWIFSIILAAALQITKQRQRNLFPCVERGMEHETKTFSTKKIYYNDCNVCCLYTQSIRALLSCSQFTSFLFCLHLFLFCFSCFFFLFALLYNC